MTNYIDSGDWVTYFSYKDSIKEYGEMDFIRSYIFTRNRYISKNSLKNYTNMVYWESKLYNYRPIDSYISLGNTGLSEQIYHKIWNWTIRADTMLVSQYFRDWYYQQYILEQADISRFGKIKEETLKQRKNNPELAYIKDVHSCFGGTFTEFLKNLENYNTSLITLKKKNNMNKFIENRIIYCYNNNIIKTNYIKINPNIEIKKTILTQSEVTRIIAEHELLINKYRWSIWNK